MARLLFVTNNLDEQLQNIQDVLETQMHQVEVAQTKADALAFLKSSPPDVILADQCLSDWSGIEVIETVRTLESDIPVVLITLPQAVNATIVGMKCGAFDCLQQPLVAVQVRQVVDKALELVRQRKQCVRPSPQPREQGLPDGLIGSSPAMREVYKSIGRVAFQDIPVLVTGESGTGKELVAQAIHSHSRRNQQVFMALNCAAIPEQLLESELFGHEKGAFSGADRRRVGRFEQANGGTLLLDEIGDMPLSLQAKMLRVLQDQSFERIGGSETIKTDVRIISATHRDLKALAATGKFREDLYYRLGVFHIQLPALRERSEDLQELVYHFLAQYGPKLNPQICAVSPKVMGALHDYSWPGNVRELQSVIKQSLLQAHGPLLLPSMLPSLTSPEPTPRLTIDESANPFDLERFLAGKITTNSEGLYEEAHREFNRLLLPQVMEHTEGNLFQAAKLLGIARQTLRRHLREIADFEPAHATRRIGVYHADEVLHADQELCSQVI